MQTPKGLRLEADYRALVPDVTALVWTSLRIDTLGLTTSAQIDEISPEVDPQKRAPS